MTELPRISVSELKQRIERGERFQFVDARNPTAWGESDRKIAGALRIPAQETEAHLDELSKDRPVAAYCT